MPYCWRTDTLRAVVIGGMAPKPSSRGKQRHSPASRAVMQAKHGKHQKAKQPETQTSIQNAYLSLHYRMRNRKWCFIEAPECLIAAANLQSDIYWCAPSAGYRHWEANLHERRIWACQKFMIACLFYIFLSTVETFPESFSTHTVAGHSSSHRSQSSICGPLWQRA